MSAVLHADWPMVQPLEYLAPFLKLVREPEVSGPITGVALTALWRLLSSGVLGEILHSWQGQHTPRTDQTTAAATVVVNSCSMAS